MDFLLNADELGSLQQYLLDRKWIAPAEELISASKPGEGNMNYVLRIRTNFRTFIIKQSRDYVEKYPQIPAPAERAVIEGQFYELIQEDDLLREYTPELSYVDVENHIIVLEDLKQSQNFSFLYKEGQEIDDADLEGLLEFLSALHTRFNADSVVPSISNMAMRQLNAEHIFRYPFMEENGFDLNTITEGLQEVAMTYKTDASFKGKVEGLSNHYLSDGHTLLHGDYYPGSWLKTFEGVRIIDPEFCFFGPAEFDVSVMLAHMRMAEQPESSREKIVEQYFFSASFDHKLMHQLEGVEIMRRLIGLAQLPLSLSLERKTMLLKEAYQLIMHT